MFSKNTLLILSICLLSLIPTSFAQTNTPTEAVTPQVYAGANLNFIFLAAHIGAKDVFIDNFGVRLDLVTGAPLTFRPIGVVSLNGLYTFHEEGNTEFYVGGGPKVTLSPDSESIFGLGALVGSEFVFESFRTFVEIDLIFAPVVAEVFVPILPVIRLGFSVPF